MTGWSAAAPTLVMVAVVLWHWPREQAGRRAQRLLRVRTDRERSARVGLVWWCRARRRQRGDRQRRRRAVLGFVDALVAELEAGQPPAGAVRSAAERSAEDPLFRGVLQHLLLGTDPVAAVQTAAQTPGADELWSVAVCLDVASTSGARLAEALRPVATGIRDDRELGREVDGQLAAPRSSARLLASLPVVVWGLGLLLGADPLRVLLTTPYGLVCLGVGVALEVVGLAWVAAMARAAVGR